MGQSTSYPSPYAFRDSTSVGYVSAPAPYVWGAYPYRAAGVAPAGEFGGFLYRSPDHYLDYRGPEYVPIAGPDVGMAVADASGHVAFEDVPMWSDEWAARIMANRQAAGLAPNEPTPARQFAAPGEFRPLLQAGEQRAAASETRPDAMRRPAIPRATTATRRPDVAVHRPAQSVMHDSSSLATPSAKSVEPHSNTETLVLNSTDGKVSVSPKRVPDSSTTTPPMQDVTDAPRVMAESVRIATPESSTLPEKSDATQQSEAPAATAPMPVSESEVPARTTTATKANIEVDAAPNVSQAEKTLTIADLNRATAAGIAIGRGDKAFEHGDYDQARAEYERALAGVGDAPGLRIALGLSDYAMGSFEDAARAIRRGVAQSPDLALSDFRLLDVYGDEDESNTHKRMLDNHLSQNPEDADALFLLGFVQYFSDQRDAARTTFGAYRSIVPHDELADPFIENVLRARSTLAE